MTTETKELLTECLSVNLAPIPNNLEHLTRVASVTGVNIGNVTLISQLKEAGFHWFVTPKIYKKFSYTAGLNGSYIRTKNSWKIIPFYEAAILITSIILTLTISQDWLYLIFTMFVPGAIPIAGWLAGEEAINYVGDIPDFILDRKEKVDRIISMRHFFNRYTIHSSRPMPVEKTNIFSKTDPVMVAWLDSDIGVVIGVWDRDNEIEL